MTETTDLREQLLAIAVFHRQAAAGLPHGRSRMEREQHLSFADGCERAAAALTPAPPDASRCSGCGGPYLFDTTIPSPLWNRVIRAQGMPEYLCTTCIVRAFVKAGEPFTAELWGAEFNGDPIEVRLRSGQPVQPAQSVSSQDAFSRAGRPIVMPSAPERSGPAARIDEHNEAPAPPVTEGTANGFCRCPACGNPHWSHVAASALPRAETPPTNSTSHNWTVSAGTQLPDGGVVAADPGGETPPEYVPEDQRVNCVDSPTDQHGYECVLCGHRLGVETPAPPAILDGGDFARGIRAARAIVEKGYDDDCSCEGCQAQSAILLSIDGLLSQVAPDAALRDQASGETPAPPPDAIREAFKAGFLAVWNPPRDEQPAGWTFDGTTAADREGEAWDAWKLVRGEAAPPPDEETREAIAALLDLARAAEQMVPDVLAVLTREDYVFRRFPRNLKEQPPVGDGERWEALAFSLYSRIGHLSSMAVRALNRVNESKLVRGEAAPPQDDLGLSIDMLYVNRLRRWADLIDTHGADITHWGKVALVVAKLREMADAVEQAVRDIGTLRERLRGEAASAPASQEKP